MKRHTPLLHLLLGLACLGLPGQARAAVTIWEELPYFSAADSPFYAGITAGDIYLEDFEDHELNTPHVISWDSPRQTNLRRDGTPTDKFPVFSRQIGRTYQRKACPFVTGPRLGCRHGEPPRLCK